MAIAALIPAHNDDYSLSMSVPLIAPFVDEVCILDDCSSDSTPDVCQWLRATQIHQMAMERLLTDSVDRIRRLPIDVMAPSPSNASRFELVYENHQIVDRIDHGWTLC